MLKVRWLMVAGSLLMVCVAGCSGPSADLPDLAPVSGTVTMGGEPLSGVAVVFESAKGQAAYGTTDQSGRYELNFKGDTKGAQVGENTVRITTPLDHPAPADYKDPIPEKYNTSSQLKVTVEPGPNTHDFTLEP